MILFINHEWIFGGSWDAKIRLQTTRQSMRDPHYQWIGSIRNRQGTWDDTDTQEGHKTSSIFWFLGARTSLAETDASIATPHSDSKNHERNPIITWSSWSRRQMIKPGTSFCTSRMFRILPTGRAARIGIWSWCVFSTEMSKGKSVRQLMSDAVSQCSSKTRAT